MMLWNQILSYFKQHTKQLLNNYCYVLLIHNTMLYIFCTYAAYLKAIIFPVTTIRNEHQEILL